MPVEQRSNPAIELQRNLINELAKITEFNDKLKDDLIFTMCNSILNSIQDNIRTDASSIWFREEQSEQCRVIMYAGSGYQQELAGTACYDTYPSDSPFCNEIKDDIEDRIGITGWVISKGVPLLVPSNTYPELKLHPFWRGLYDKKQHKYTSLEIESFLAVPIRGKDGFILGLIKCERMKNSTSACSFSVNDQVLLESLARIAAKCKTYCDEICEIRNGDSIESRIDSAIKIWTNELLMDAFNFEDNTDNYLNEASKIIQNATNSHSCAIFLIDKSKKTITQRGGSGYQELRKAVRSYSLPQRQFAECKKHSGESGLCKNTECPNYKKNTQKIGLTAWIAVSEMAFVARNRKTLLSHCHHKGVYDKLNFESDFVCGGFIGYPLRIGGTVIGVLKIEKQTKKSSDPEEFLFTDIIVNRALTIAYELSYIISKIDDVNNKRMEIFKKSDSVISSILQAGQDLNQLIKTVVNQTRELFNSRACALYLKVGDKLVQPEWAAVGWTKNYSESHQYDMVNESAIRTDPVSAEEIEELAGDIYSGILEMLVEAEDTGFVKDSYLKSETGGVVRYLLSDSVKNDSDKLVKLQTILKRIKFNRIGLTVWIAVKKEKFIARSFEELQAHPHHRGTFDLDNFTNDEKCESFMGIPLIINENEVAGVLKVETKMKPGITGEYDFFSAQDEFLFELIARITAIAIDNARRFEEERLFWQLVVEKDSNTLFKILNDFIKGKSDAKEKLLEINNVIRTLDKNKAEFIDCFMGILNQALSAGSLEKIKELLQPPLKDYFSLFEAALCLEKIEDISGFTIVNALNPQSFTNNYDVYHAHEILTSDLMKKISARINSYLMDNSRKSELHAAYNELLAQQKKINGFIFGIEGNIYRRIIDKFLMEISASAKVYTRIVSPYLVGNALEHSSKVFFGREKIFGELLTNVNQRAIVLSGQGRIGKTSLINRFKSDNIKALLKDACKAEVYPVIIRLHNHVDADYNRFLLGIADSIHEQLKDNFKIVKPDNTEFIAEKGLNAFIGYIKTIYQITSKQAVKIFYIFDEYEAIYQAGDDTRPKLYMKLRELIDTVLNAQFIFVGRASMREVPREFSQTIISYCLPMYVGLLEEASATSLIVDPVKEFGVQFEDDAIKAILVETMNHPLLIQLICNKCIAKLNEQKHNTIVTAKMVKDSVANIMDNECALFEDLWNDLQTLHRDYAGIIFKEFVISEIVSYSALRKKAYDENILKEKLDIFCRKMILKKTEDNYDSYYSIMIPMFRNFIRKKYY